MPEKIHRNGNFQAVLNRVLESQTFRHSDSLRHLLRYLGEKSLSGQAAELKEFTIGVEALGRPEDYNPQIDPSVRVQAGRLRHKLSDYYEDEGRDDPVRITLPKRHYLLRFESTPDRPAEKPAAKERPPVERATQFWRGVALAATLATAVFATRAFYQPAPSTDRPGASARPASVPAEMRAFWRPYLEGGRPVVLSLGVPMFVWFEGPVGAFLRDPLANEWPLTGQQAEFSAVQRALTHGAMHPVYEYCGVGEAMGAFALGKHLAAAGLDTTLVRSSHLSWDQIKKANVIYIGAPKHNPQLRARRFNGNFKVVTGGIENKSPRAGEKAFYGREALPNGRPKLTHAIISRYPAQDQLGCITVLSSWDGAGTWAAVEYLTQPASLKEIDRILGDGRDHIPESFEFVIRARIDMEYPVEFSYVAHRIYQEAPEDPAATPDPRETLATAGSRNGSSVP